MFGIGSTELIIILVIVIVIFGASRLPKLGRGLGEGLRGFKDALKGSDEDAEKPASPPAKKQPTRADPGSDQAS